MVGGVERPARVQHVELRERQAGERFEVGELQLT